MSPSTTSVEVTYKSGGTDSSSNCSKLIVIDPPATSIAPGDSVSVTARSLSSEVLQKTKIYSDASSTPLRSVGPQVQDSEVTSVVLDFNKSNIVSIGDIIYEVVSIIVTDKIYDDDATAEVRVNDLTHKAAVWATSGQNITSKLVQIGQSCLSTSDSTLISGKAIMTYKRPPFHKEHIWDAPVAATRERFRAIYLDEVIDEYEINIDQDPINANDPFSFTIRVAQAGSDAPVPRATVRVSSEDSGETTSYLADENGLIFLTLLPGDYSLSATASGMAPLNDIKFSV